MARASRATLALPLKRLRHGRRPRLCRRRRQRARARRSRPTAREAPEQWHRDHIGRVVQSRLEEGDLRRAARETSGGYLRLDGRGSEHALAAELARLEKRTLVLPHLARAGRPIPVAARPGRADAWRWSRCSASCADGGREPHDGSAGVRQPCCRLQPWAAATPAGASGCTSRDTTARLRPGVSAGLRRLRRPRPAATTWASRSTGSSGTRMRPRAFARQPAFPTSGSGATTTSATPTSALAEEAAEKDEPLRQAIAAYEEALRLEPADSAAKWNLELAISAGARTVSRAAHPGGAARPTTGGAT